MKKEYVRPLAVINHMQIDSCLLAGSPDAIGKWGPGETPAQGDDDGFPNAKGNNVSIWDAWDE